MSEPTKGGGALLNEGVRARIENLGGKLTPVQAAIARYLLTHPQQVLTVSLEPLADEIGVSPASMVAFSQYLGFKGMRHLKLALAREMGSVAHALQSALDETLTGTVEADDAPFEVLRKTVQQGVRSLNQTLELISDEALERAVATLDQASFIELYAAGESQAVAADAFHRLRKLGLRVSLSSDLLTQALGASRLRPRDVALVISHTGRLKQAVEVARRAKEAGATVLALTSQLHSPLGRLADVTLVAGSGEASEAAAPVRVAHLVVVAALATSLALRRAEASRDAPEEEQLEIRDYYG